MSPVVVRRDRILYGMRAVELFIKGGDLTRAEELAVKMVAEGNYRSDTFN